MASDNRPPPAGGRAADGDPGSRAARRAEGRHVTGVGQLHRLGEPLAGLVNAELRLAVPPAPDTLDQRERVRGDVLPLHAAATLAAQPYGLAAELEGALGRRVDVVVLDTAPPDLVHRVLRDGILVLDRDRSKRIGFEVAARNAYFDLKPFLDRYRSRAA